MPKENTGDVVARGLGVNDEEERDPAPPTSRTEVGSARSGSLRGLSRTTWKVTLLSLGGWALVNADSSLFNLNYPLIARDLGITDKQIGVIYALIYAVGAASTFLAGPIMDRVGRKPVFQACLFAAVLGSVLTAGAPGVLVLVVARGLTQAGASTEWMAGQVMVAEEAPAAVRGRLIGIAQVGYPLGFFLGSLLSWAIVPLLGWRWLFVFGILPVVVMIWARRAVNESHRFRASRAQEPGVHSGHLRQIFAADLRRSSILVSIWHVVYAFGFAGIASYLPTVYGAYGISLDHTYLSSAIATAVAGVGYLLSSAVGERIGRREASMLWLTLGAGAGLYMAFAGTTLVSLTVGYSLIYFFLAGHITAAVGYAAEVFPTRVRGTGANLVAGMEWIGFFCAALFGPYLFDAIGVPTTLLIWLTICPLVAVGCAAGMRRIRPGTVLEDIAR